jgi:hypothetical protein
MRKIPEAVGLMVGTDIVAACRQDVNTPEVRAHAEENLRDLARLKF